ncbi:MAG: cysteine--tRNA ligase [Candidatus Aenigmatarchaeota archaeon]
MHKLKLYNTLTRKKEIFKPLNDNKVGMYSCGPTVYWYQHIGNLRTYIFVDILKRVLLYNGYEVTHVMNITDVGHLTSDADTGEDKIELAAKREGKSAKEIAEYYTKIFMEDLKKLNILPPTIWCKASEHIKEQIELIKKIEEKGFTYRTSDGIYFDTSKLEDYGKLARLDKKGLLPGKRVPIKEKRNPTDFALWKFSEKPGIRQQEWESPWGIGYPGWHIECSAMSSKYLGEQFDIHTGGEDHIHIHHTNEIAQSEVAFGKKPWVRYWLHARFLTFKGEKISKSKGGLYTLSDLEKMGFHPLAYRYFVLSAHYRKTLDFSLEKLKEAQESYFKLKSLIFEISTKEKNNKINKKYLKEFEKFINDDLNTPKALQTLWKLVRDKKAKGKLATIKEMDKVFALDLIVEGEIPEYVKKLVEKREILRKEKKFDEADKIREELKKMGYLIEDTKDGPKIKKI